MLAALRTREPASQTSKGGNRLFQTHNSRWIIQRADYPRWAFASLIGSVRRECLDHIIVLGEAHLRRILKSYARYYNEMRTHLALDKDAPLSRTVKRAGRILCRPILGGLHHEYVRI